MDDLLLCSPSQASSQEDIIHLLKLLALKEHKVAKEKLQFAQNQVQYFSHPISEQGLHLDPDTLHGVLSFPKPQTKGYREVFSDQLVIAEIGFQISLLKPNFLCFSQK